MPERQTILSRWIYAKIFDRLDRFYGRTEIEIKSFEWQMTWDEQEDENKNKFKRKIDDYLAKDFVMKSINSNRIMIFN